MSERQSRRREPEASQGPASSCKGGGGRFGGAGMGDPGRLRVAVVGAGAAGLCVARHLLARPHDFHAPCVWELDSAAGGTWVYKQQRAEANLSSIYRDLRTNLPKEVMAFPDFPFDKSLPSFLHHSDVRAYLDKYIDHFHIRPHIKLKWRVERVQPVPAPEEAPRDVAWDLTARSLADGEVVTERYDSVIVCNGHYSKPYLPDIPGLADFKGQVLHSHDYRSRERFAGQAVALLGAGNSGQDIAVDVSPVAREVWLCHRRAPLRSRLPDNVRQAPSVRSFTERGVLLADGSERAADAFVFCTGYEYAFPFLAPEARVSVGDRRVSPLYKHMIHAATPTLVFVGLCKLVNPFAFFDCQARYALATLRDPALLPPRPEMDAEVRRELEAQRAAGVPERDCHLLGDRQWAYMAELARLLGTPEAAPSAAVRALFDAVRAHREANLLAYRSLNYGITGDGEDGWCVVDSGEGSR
uniref:Flavin-containing monooxygenase n=1 Tax=Petromyzon marinus TaxID=7757 RepID=A0AAJ7SWM1_PETMA|nr:flavin-containing monooxygenase FMO GS-OX5-like [Petromyzon marinus]